MKREIFQLKKTLANDWGDVFKNPCPIKVTSFITGHVIVNKLGALNPKHPNAGEIKDEPLKVPILAHWIQHAQYGDYLVDSGLDSSYYGDPYGKIKGVFAGLFKRLNLFVDGYIQGKNQDISFHLKKNSVNLKGVFLSHLHSDHVAGVRDLPKDIPYVVGKGEKYKNHKFFKGNYLKGIKVLYEIDFSKAPNMPILGPCADIFGDGSFWAISTPGHTHRHISFLINGEKCPILLATDACFIKLGFEKGIGSSDYTDDVLMAQSSLNNLVEFKKCYPQVKVICGHEI